MIALLDLGASELHLPSREHGVAVCGQVMPDPWRSAPLATLYAQCEYICQACFDKVTVDGSGA